MTFRNSPISPDFSRILEMGRNLSEAAIGMGLSATKSVKVTINGTLVTAWPPVPAQRCAIVSFSMPTPSTVDAQLWVNPINKRIFKSLPETQQWAPVLSYNDLFFEQEAPSSPAQPSDSVGQPVQNIPMLLALNTSSLPDKAMYYVEDEHAIYALDLQSADPISTTVLKPSSGPGRWYLITSTAGAIGNIDGGTF